MTTKIELLPSQVDFSQSTINSTFRNGNTLEATLEQLKNGEIEMKDFPPIRVVRRDGKIYTLDNRRLWLFKNFVGKTRTKITFELWSDTDKNEKGELIEVELNRKLTKVAQQKKIYVKEHGGKKFDICEDNEGKFFYYDSHYNMRLLTDKQTAKMLNGERSEVEKEIKTFTDRQTKIKQTKLSENLRKDEKGNYYYIDPATKRSIPLPEADSKILNQKKPSNEIKKLKKQIRENLTSKINASKQIEKKI